jgi:hypothetical protein
MPAPGNVVVLSFPGAVTTNLAAANAPTDWTLRDWQVAGLLRPSAFRCYITTVPQIAVRMIGRLSANDWQSVQACVRSGVAVT